MIEIELKPCPFCGGKADFNNDGERWQQVICGSCGCRGCEYPDDRAKAAAAWNRRSVAGVAAGLRALFVPSESHAGDNLEGALHDIKRLSKAGRPTDEVCIRTIERVIRQLGEAESSILDAADNPLPVYNIPQID